MLKSFSRSAIAAVALPAMLGIAGIGPGVAGELVDHAVRAESFAVAGKPVQGLAEMEAAFNAAWDAAPLGFSEALFVSRKPAGFGLYDPRPNAVFAPGEPLIVYAEPFGYGFADKGGQFAISFSADFSVKTKNGLVLQEQDGFATLTTVSRRRNKEFQVSVSYSLQGLKAGDYILSTRLTDKATAKSASFDLPFSISK